MLEILKNMTDKKNNWSINLETIKCPECDSKQPALRIPENLEQLMFGGWNCENCSCKMDKHGNKIIEKNK
jgi:hypothetical protein